MTTSQLQAAVDLADKIINPVSESVVSASPFKFAQAILYLNVENTRLKTCLFQMQEAAKELHKKCEAQEDLLQDASENLLDWSAGEECGMHAISTNWQRKYEKLKKGSE